MQTKTKIKLNKARIDNCHVGLG